MPFLNKHKWDHMLQFILTCLSNITWHRQLMPEWLWSESEGRSVVYDYLRPHGLYSLWNSTGQNTGVGSLSLLQGIFPTRGSNPCLPYCRQILYQLSHQSSPRILEWVAYPFPSGSSRPRNWTGISCQTEKATAPNSSTLAWKIPWAEEPGRLQSMGSLRVGNDWTTSLWLFTFMHWRRKWPPTPVFLPGESQGQGSLVGFCPWGHTELDMTDAT